MVNLIERMPTTTSVSSQLGASMTIFCCFQEARVLFQQHSLPMHAPLFIALTERRDADSEIYSCFYFLASVFGSAIGSVLLSNHVYILNGLSIACYLSTAYVASSGPEHYGRADSAGGALQPFANSSDEDFSNTVSPARESRLPHSSAKVAFSLISITRPYHAPLIVQTPALPLAAFSPIVAHFLQLPPHTLFRPESHIHRPPHLPS